MRPQIKGNAIRSATFVSVVSLAVNIFSTQLALALVATVPTAGVATTSMIVGTVGSIQGTSSDLNPSKGSRITVGFLSSFLLIADPEPATFMRGQSVLSYPDSLLDVEMVSWFGPFALDPSLPAPETSSTGFVEVGGIFELQPPNAALSVSVSDTGGILTIGWDASASGGIAVETAESFNFMGILFQNVSGGTLELELDFASPNLFQNISQQSFVCIPAGSDEPVTCGSDAPPASYRVTSVPESNNLLLGALILVSLVGHASHQRFSRQSGSDSTSIGQS